jgi:hypothetical protein
MKSIIMVSKSDLTLDSLKALDDLITSNPKVLSHILGHLFESINGIKSLLIENKQDAKEMRFILTKVVPLILEVLTDLYSPDNFSLLNPNKEPHSKFLFDVVEKVTENIITYPRSCSSQRILKT